MIGAICGLGYDPETSRPLFGENDIEITFDTIINNGFLNKVNPDFLEVKICFYKTYLFFHQINVIRMFLNKCVNPEDEEGPGDIFEYQDELQKTLIE